MKNRTLAEQIMKDDLRRQGYNEYKRPGNIVGYTILACLFVLLITSICFVTMDGKPEPNQQPSNIKVIKTGMEQPYNVKYYYLFINKDTIVGVQKQ